MGPAVVGLAMRLRLALAAALLLLALPVPAQAEPHHLACASYSGPNEVTVCVGSHLCADVHLRVPAVDEDECVPLGVAS